MPRRASGSSLDEGGFTLIELLGVVSIIAVLLGIVLTAIETVNRFSRTSIARVEVRTIEDAWKRYFDHYNRWPSLTEGTFVVAELSAPDVYLTYRVDATVGAALEGRIEDDPAARELNPDGLHLMEFTRYAEQTRGGGQARTPVNPWHRGETLAAQPAAEQRDGRLFYYVRFDVNANDRISLSGLPLPTEVSHEAASRSVIVWTVNPDDPEEFIASWRR